MKRGERRHRDHRQLGHRPGAAACKAARDAGLNVNFYTYYAGVIGTPTAVGEAGEDRMRQIAVLAPEHRRLSGRAAVHASSRRSSTRSGTRCATHTSLNMLAEAMKRSEVDRPAEGRVRDGRREDGRACTATSRCARPTTSCCSRCAISSWTKVGGQELKHDVEKHRLHVEDRGGVPDLRRVAADVLPDEAPGAPPVIPPMR